MKAFKVTLCIGLFFGGFGMVAHFANWQVAVGIFMAIWSYNLERAL